MLMLSFGHAVCRNLARYTQCLILSVVTLSVVMLSVMATVQLVFNVSLNMNII